MFTHVWACAGLWCKMYLLLWVTEVNRGIALTETPSTINCSASSLHPTGLSVSSRTDTHSWGRQSSAPRNLAFTASFKPHWKQMAQGNWDSKYLEQVSKATCPLGESALSLGWLHGSWSLLSFPLGFTAWPTLGWPGSLNTRVLGGALRGLGGGGSDMTSLKVCFALLHGGCQPSLAHSLCDDALFLFCLGWPRLGPPAALSKTPLPVSAAIRSEAIESPDGRKTSHAQETGVQAWHGPF